MDMSLDKKNPHAGDANQWIKRPVGMGILGAQMSSEKHGEVQEDP